MLFPGFRPAVFDDIPITRGSALCALEDRDADKGKDAIMDSIRDFLGKGK